MLLFNCSDKKLASPPVKITVKSEYFSLYVLIQPSISFTTPLTTPECIELSVDTLQ